MLADFAQALAEPLLNSLVCGASFNLAEVDLRQKDAQF
jgi:hypothetical protein